VVVEDVREREKRRLRDDSEIAGQRLQDVTNAFGSRVSLPPLDTKVSGMDPSVSNPVLFICWQIWIITERRQIPTQIYFPRHSLALPARRFRHLEPHPHHRTFPRPATRVHHRYPSRLANPIPQQWAVSAACARASIMLSLSSTRTYSVSYVLSLWSDLIFSMRRKMRKPDPALHLLKRKPSGSQPLLGENPRHSLEDTTTVTERRRKSRPRPPVDDDESDGAQADDEPLAGTSVRAGLSNVDMRRRSAVVSVSRRSFIEDDEGRRHSMLV
jgi:hypothetical protein